MSKLYSSQNSMNSQTLKLGYTTGSCDQAAAKAAVMMLTSGKIVETVEILTASGAELNISLSDMEIGDGFARWRNQRFR